MFELRGQYGTAKVFIDELEQTAVSQIIQLLNSPISENSKIRIMPDAHAGAGCVIGYTATLTDKVVCNLVGVDVGCGVSAWKIENKKIDFSVLDKFIRHVIPSGRNVRSTVYDISEFFDQVLRFASADNFIIEIEKICKTQNQNFNRVMNSIGSLGGGNHFIEVDKGSDGFFWLVIHSGSRNFGLQIATYHQRIAYDNHGAKMGGLAWLKGSSKSNYLKDMECAQEYARLNRKVIGQEIMNGFGFKHVDSIESVHNYINFDDSIIRKGAISAHRDERVIISLNMADGVIIGLGKGNSDWNNSAPHGAGRTLARRKAKETLKLEDFRKRMKDAGVWTTCVSKNTLDESPMAYKDSKRIIEYLKDSIYIEDQMKPVYNFKSPN